MDRIKSKFRNMSLKKSLILSSSCCLGLVSLFTVITILKLSSVRQDILDTRPVYISNYSVGAFGENNGGVLLTPYEYNFGNLPQKSQLYYWTATLCMALLPVCYIIAGSVSMAKLYYRCKIRLPLKDLKNGMEHIARQDLDFHLNYRSGDELGKLCETFEYMKNEIYVSNRKMWEALRERKALTASVSHDLRTPITVLNGYLDYLDKALKREALTEDILRSTLDSMAEAAARLERYIACVRDAQRLEDIEIKKERFSLRKYTSGLFKDFSLLAQKQNTELTVQNLAESAYLEADKALLTKVLENIFNNALRFSAGKIVFTVSENKDSFLFSIQDNGKGFTSEELTSAASFFYSSPVNKGDFGIGLSICKILCESFGGSLHLKNVPGQGALVIVKIKKPLFAEI